MIDTIGRHPERASQDRGRLDELLRSQTTGVLSAVSPDGRPWAVPMLHVLDEDRLLFHGSTGAGLLRHARAGAPVVYTVFVLDAWVLGHTAFSSSANYRSATIRGSITDLTGAEKVHALEVLTDGLFPGRTDEVPPLSRKELAATAACQLTIMPGQWLYKQRAQTASTPEEPTDAWGGVIPVTRGLGAPVRAPWSTAPLPTSVQQMLADT